MNADNANADILKAKLKEIFGSQIVFNKEFDNYASSIKNIDENLISWCIEAKGKRKHKCMKNCYERLA